jgi:hypothetical protein
VSFAHFGKKGTKLSFHCSQPLLHHSLSCRKCCDTNQSIQPALHTNVSLNSLSRSSALAMEIGLLTGTFSLLCCLNHFSSASLASLCSGFHNRLICDPFCSKTLTILSRFSHIVWTVELTIPNSRYVSAFLFPLSISLYHFKLFSTHKTFLSLVTTATLLLYSSACY